MIKNADIDKILDEGYGDAGFNDPVSDEDEKPARRVEKGKPAALAQPPPPKALPPKAGPPAQNAARKPNERPAVLGVTPPPPEGANPEEYEVLQTLDEQARKMGYNDVQEYDRYLQTQQSGNDTDVQKEMAQMQEPQLAPGIKKAPAYMPPGAYPGDRTKLGKAYDADMPAAGPPAKARRKDSLQSTYVKQAETYGPGRPTDGNVITFRTADAGAEQELEVGDTSLPWGLESTVRKMKVGDIMDVVGVGEYAVADDERLRPDAESRWRLELVSIAGRAKDKFKLDSEQRIERANMLRLRGNAMFKQNRYLRAMDYYERGSSLMDVLEAEDLGMPGMKNKEAARRNEAIWSCQKPLLLNWALILIKLGQWAEAERKCTEVLMDIDKLNVKALYRRGECNIHLGDQAQARTDLMRARELDTSIAPEVERLMVRVEAMQAVEDRNDAGLARKVVQDILEAGDARSEAPPPVAAPAPAPQDYMINMLESQRSATEGQDIDDDSYCRQREAIYNQFFATRPADDA